MLAGPVATPGRESRAGVVLHLQRSEFFRDYQSAFDALFGLPLALRAAGSFQPPQHGSKRVNPFCSLMAATSKTCAACLQLQQQVEAAAISAPTTLECFAGLSESAVPIRLGESVVGYLQTGQVLMREPSEAMLSRVVSRLNEWEAGIDGREVRALYLRTRVVTRRHYESIVRLLAIFAGQLSALSNQIMLRQAAGEKPTVAKARDFIAAHLGEPLPLGRVAQAVHASPFYFCKVFRQETGLRYTEYLARARIERVKQLLLDPHVRIGEAAFAAGFQSLSQFNRVFHRFAGESPKAHRNRLRGTGKSAPRRRALIDAA